MQDDMRKCNYCGCEAMEHPTESIPLGAFACANCGECPLTEEHVIALSKHEENKER